jgi:hypothetical protein
MRRKLVALLTVLALAAPAARALAFEGFVGTRPLGMGGAGRAFATGDAGPLLNPSGMSLIRQYAIEGDYGFASPRNDQYLHASVVDSTSAYLVAGGLYYTYHLSHPTGLPSGTGHEAGLALSLPFGQFVAIGATLKYFRMTGIQAPDGHDGGFTFDVGVSVRPSPQVSLAVVGQNLRNLENSEAPQQIGYGVAFLAATDLTVALDGVTPFAANTYTGRRGTSILAGGDLLLAHHFGVRLGGGYDGVSGNGFGTAGFSYVGDVGAVDVGAREDLFKAAGSPRATVLGVSLRLFVPDTLPPQ